MSIWDEIKQSFKQGSMVTRLVYINLGVFLLLRVVMVLFRLFNVELPVVEWLSLPADITQLIYRPWTLITYMFLHYQFFHILFNMLWLYWFGKMFLMYFDEKKLLGLYFLGGIAGGVLYIISYNFFPFFDQYAQQSILLGASASVISIVIAVAVYAPNYSVNLLLISSFLGPIKLKWIAIFSVVLYILEMTGSNAGGNIAHLGGALWGYLYMTQLKKGNNFTSKFNNFIFNVDKLFRKQKNMRVSYRSTTAQTMNDWEYNKRKKEEKENINDILDKISKAGYDSLSKHEKEILFKMGKRGGKPN